MFYFQRAIKTLAGQFEVYQELYSMRTFVYFMIIRARADTVIQFCIKK